MIRVQEATLSHSKTYIQDMIKEISKMSEDECLDQLDWSDPYEFGTIYAYYLLKENKKLKEELKEKNKNE